MKYFKNILIGYKEVLFLLTRKNEKEIQSLNGLRVISIALIFIVHTWGFAIPIVAAEILHSKVSEILTNSASGVDLFLILSGFLISLGLKMQWNRTGRIDFILFFKKRILRIFPAYYVFLLISLIVFVIYKVPFSYKGFIIDIFYLSNYFQGQMPHSWSLALEEQFYLFFPFFAHYILFKRSTSKRLIILLLLYLIPTISRIYLLATIQNMDALTYAFKIYKPAHTRLDAVIVGIILMEIYTEKNAIVQFMNKGKNQYVTFLISLLLLYFAHTTSHINGQVMQALFRYNFMNIGYAFLFILFLGKNYLSDFFSKGFFRPIARVSYTMYLWHFIFGGIGARLTPFLNFNPFTWTMLIYAWTFVFLFTFFLSTFAFGIIEYPFMRKKENL